MIQKTVVRYANLALLAGCAFISAGCVTMSSPAPKVDTSVQLTEADLADVRKIHAAFMVKLSNTAKEKGASTCITSLAFGADLGVGSRGRDPIYHLPVGDYSEAGPIASDICKLFKEMPDAFNNLLKGESSHFTRHGDTVHVLSYPMGQGAYLAFGYRRIGTSWKWYQFEWNEKGK